MSEFLQQPKRKMEKESSRRSKNFRSLQEGSGEIEMEETDIQLQQVLFNSGKKLESRSNEAAGKKVQETPYEISKMNNILQKGESSCAYCVICDDAKPPNMLKRGSSCLHYYCEECIRIYIGKKINENVYQVKCPVSNCKNFLDLISLMPMDFLVRADDAALETEVLASPQEIGCPFGDCTGKLVDDKKGFLIRACPQCWRIFCVVCREAWHVGMTCDAYRQMTFSD
ncbi:RING finger protein [Datura stramonium]|uniref:RBR-type E3 ubiquitin transferase n=1 Tax=Datura stramonium TaxID=4076 RepID=A0ABS8SP62_DATST|nr:RING finger protein [Datura stramonium]